MVCSAVGWILRISEEGSEVDEDFPPPDRTGKISGFNFDAYVVLEALSAQSKTCLCNLVGAGLTNHTTGAVQQNKTLKSKIQCWLLCIIGKKKKQVPDGSFLSVNSLLVSGMSATASPLGMSQAVDVWTRTSDVPES